MKTWMWLFLSAFLILSCEGSVQTHDEPQDFEEPAGDPDGGDDAAIDDGDAQGDDAQLGDDAEPADDARPGDDAGSGDDGPDPVTEMLLFDGDERQFTYDDSGFHVLINPGDQIPAPNWVDPVDYYNGEFQVRYVINSPPDQAAGRLQTCIWTMGDDGVGGNYFPESCGQQVSHTGVGEYFVTSNLCPADWWKKDGVSLDYSHPERFLVRVVLRGTSGCNVTRYNVSGACWDQWPDYENMNFRVTIVMVGSGGTFSGWGNYP